MFVAPERRRRAALALDHRLSDPDPLYEAVSLIWFRESGLQPVGRFPEGVNARTEAWLNRPQYYIISNKLPFLRRRLSGPEAVIDFPLL